MPATPRQASRLYAAFSALLRACQFRDRERVNCSGLSVTQCYTLDWLTDHGPATMGALAQTMHLDLSTMTRAIDQLVRAEMVLREADERDGRVCRVRITPRGRRRVLGIRRAIVAEHQQVLDHIAPESREAVIEAMARLLRAFLQRQSCSGIADAAGNRKGNRSRPRAVKAGAP